MYYANLTSFLTLSAYSNVIHTSNSSNDSNCCLVSIQCNVCNGCNTTSAMDITNAMQKQMLLLSLHFNHCVKCVRNVCCILFLLLHQLHKNHKSTQKRCAACVALNENHPWANRDLQAFAAGPPPSSQEWWSICRVFPSQAETSVHVLPSLQSLSPPAQPTTTCTEVKCTVAMLIAMTEPWQSHDESTDRHRDL